MPAYVAFLTVSVAAHGAVSRAVATVAGVAASCLALLAQDEHQQLQEQQLS